MNERPGLVLVMLLLLALFLIQAANTPAYAHFNTLAPDTDVQLQWPLNDSYSMSLDLKVLQSPEANASIFWGYQFTFMNGERGFVAFGIGGSPKVATVGVFDAFNATTSNPNGGCEAGISFLKAGSGYQCFILYNWNIDADYRLQFSRTTDSGGYEQWQGSILDSSNSSTLIGSLLVTPDYGQLSTNSSTWDEYSSAGSCDTTPTSVVFSYPYAMNTNGNHAPAKGLVTYGSNVCQDSNVKYLGGGAYEADAGRNVTRTTPPNTWLWTQEPSLVRQSSTSSSETSSTSVSSVPASTASPSMSTTSTSSKEVPPSQESTVVAVSSNTTPLAVPSVPGFPWESIIVGIIVGLTLIATNRHKNRSPKPAL